MRRNLSDAPVFRGLRERLLADGATRDPRCDSCHPLVPVQDWPYHRARCPQRPTRHPAEVTSTMPPKEAA